MASAEGLMPITRSFLAAYYDKYPFAPLSDDVSRLSIEIRTMAFDLLAHSPPSPSLSQDEIPLVEEVDRQPPHKVDENMWKNREQLEEIIFLLDKSRLPLPLQQPATPDDSQLATVFDNLRDKFQKTLKTLESFQAKNSERVFNIVMTYMPQDFRGTLIKQQRERSERNKQAEVDALINSGGSIKEKYALLWRQQMDRRRQLAQLGSATGVYKTLMKYLVGVPQVLLDFVQQINDDDGPMEEQRQRYGPPLYSLTIMVLLIHLYILLVWRSFQASQLSRHGVAILEQAVDTYTCEFERFIAFISDVFANSPFFISAEVAGTLEGRKSEEYKELSIPAGKTHEVTLSVDSINSYIGWDFSLIQGKMNMDIGFSVEYTDQSGLKTLILPYRRETSAHAWLETTNLYGIIHILRFSRRCYAIRWTAYPRWWSQCNLPPKQKVDGSLAVVAFSQPMPLRYFSQIRLHNPLIPSALYPAKDFFSCWQMVATDSCHEYCNL